MLWVSNMDYVKAWIISVCGAMLAAAVFKILLSDSTLKKSVNVFLSVFILFYTVIPLQNYIKNSEFQSQGFENYTFEYEEALSDSYKKIIEESIKNICTELGASLRSIDIKSSVDADGYMVVESIDISVNTNGTSEKEKIKSEILKRLGFEVNIA